MNSYQAKVKLQKEDPKYLRLYATWGRVQGVEEMTRVLAPLEDVAQLEEMLDAFASTPQASYTEAELKKLEFARAHGRSEVFRRLIDGVENKPSQTEKLDALLANFKTLGPEIFDYTMSATSPDYFLDGVTPGGDCNTVVHAFRLIADEYFGIAATRKSSKEAGYAERFIAPQATTIDGQTGNVDGGAFWLFDNHYWIEADGNEYDVLFGRKGVDPNAWTKEVGEKENPSIFGTDEKETKIWTTGKKYPISERYTTTQRQ